jgi:hypothetical protein
MFKLLTVIFFLAQVNGDGWNERLLALSDWLCAFFKHYAK